MQLTKNATILSFLRSLPGDSGEPLTIDFSGVSFVDPGSVVGLACLADRGRAAGRQVTFMAPSGYNVRNYLSRMHLGEVLDALGVTHDLGRVRENDLSTELLELVKFSGRDSGDELGTLLYDKLEARSDVHPEVAESLQNSIAELSTNVRTHAQVDHGYAMAQTIPNRSLIRFAIGDAGIGLKKSLEKNRDLPVDDDKNAIGLAVQANVTSTGERGRGTGLAEVVGSTVGFGGKVMLASGGAAVLHERATPEGEDGPLANVSYTWRLSNAYNGTIVQGEICYQPGE